VALKFLPRDVAEGSRRFQLFLSEVRLSRQIAHPNVCRVYDIGEVDGQHFLSMEYIDGEDLKGLLRRIGRLPSDKGIEIAKQLCAGLAAAHEKGVLHRDLKPANIMIDGRGQARITDFGLACLADGVSGVGEIAGTPAYTDLKNYLRSLRYGAAQIDRIFSGSRQTALQDSVAASRKAS
jgi:serine/threonine protein kinase